ncbi:MAG: right-handed parallel beta-helix repeat-containing protein [Verrucomicrobium sp.]
MRLTFCLLLIAAASSSFSASAHSAPPRVLEVDPGGSTPYKTIASAAKAVQPGDTLRLKPNSGPYREILLIKTSGTAEAPITIDGGNNVVTGFDPITTWEEKDGTVFCKVKTFPCVIAHQGERLVHDATTKQFTKYADLNETKDTLTLRPGVSQEGWEISKRAFAVQITNASHHIYRNLRASGSTNDGFNLHGEGADLLFENIEGFQNLDEGYSSHDSIISVIRGAKFWGNDNGIANSFRDQTTLSTTVVDTDVYDNLGFGVSLHDCSAVLQNVRIWHNGLRQLRFNAATIECENVTVYTPKHRSRQWLSYTDSKDLTNMFAYSAGKECVIKGTPPKVLEDEDAPKD